MVHWTSAGEPPGVAVSGVVARRSPRGVPHAVLYSRNVEVASDGRPPARALWVALAVVDPPPAPVGTPSSLATRSISSGVTASKKPLIRDCSAVVRQGPVASSGSASVQAAKPRRSSLFLRRIVMVSSIARARAVSLFLPRVPLAVCCQCGLKHGRTSRPWHPSGSDDALASCARILRRPVEPVERGAPGPVRAGPVPP